MSKVKLSVLNLGIVELHDYNNTRDICLPNNMEFYHKVVNVTASKNFALVFDKECTVHMMLIYIYTATYIY